MDSSTNNEFQKMGTVGSILVPPQVANFIQGIFTVVMIMLGWQSITVEVFLRREFGERYLSVLRIILALAVLSLYHTLFMLMGAFRGNVSPLALFMNPSGLSALFTGDVSSRYYFFFWWAFVIVTTLHLIAIKRREHQGIEWHTQSFGSSYLEELPVWSLWNSLVSRLPWGVGAFLAISEWTIYCIFEPLLCYLASFPVYQFDGLLGTWLWLAAFALFIKNLIFYYTLRGRLQDMSDADIESKHLNAALRGENKEQTAGFSVVPMTKRYVGTSGKIDINATVQEALRAVDAVKQDATEEILNGLPSNGERTIEQ